MNPGLPVPLRANYSEHSLVAYLGVLVKGRRVGVVGPSSGEVAKRARALGASTVVSFGGTGDGVAIRPLSTGAIEAFRGRLDVVVIPDAGAVPIERVLEEARHALGQDGLVVVASRPLGAPSPLEASPGGQGPDFHALRDALALRFAHVTMLGRGPFVGYVYARIEAEDGEPVTLDTRLLPDEAAAAEAFVAVAGDHTVELDGLALVQIPTADVLGQPTPVDTLAIEGELARRDAKIKELENASAERWVRVQQLENERKSLDEEACKARERAVRLAKDLEDERKLRQRTELEGQIQRRAPDFAHEIEEAKAARERSTQLEKDLAAALAERATAAAKRAELERELDEAQAAERELRAQLDAAEVARKHTDDESEFVKIERGLQARGEVVLRLERQLSERDGAISELTYALESAQSRNVAGELQAARERIAELSGLNTGLAAEARGIVEQNDVLRERVVKLESEAKTSVADLEAVHAAERDAVEAREALRLANERAAVQEQRAARDAAGLAVASQQLAAARAETSRLLAEVRNELTAQHAMAVSLDERRSQIETELAGARAGYQRRVLELEREVESLVRSLEVVGTHAEDEDQKFEVMLRNLDTLTAERDGLSFRLGDAEAALAVRAMPMAAPAEAVVPGDEASEAMANDQLLEDLAETAARLASTEESLVATRETALEAERRGEELASELENARAELRAVAAGAPGRQPGGDVESSQRESAERELLVRSLVAQLEDRDLRLRALERRLVEDVERARRTESEIWEVELRARDQRVAGLTREVERARSESLSTASTETDAVSLKLALEGMEREVETLRTAIEIVRTGLSNILVDGRGAVVAHDLVTILRQIE